METEVAELAGNMSKIDYSGRTVDLLLLKTVLDVPVAGERVDLDASGVPMIVAGVEKMVQRYAVAFINSLGSTKFRPRHGTGIVDKVGKGLVYDMSTLEAAAAEANLNAMKQIKAADALEGTPDDERLEKSEVYNLKFSRPKSSVGISVRLTTAAGKSFVYIIPVPVGVH